MLNKLIDINSQIGVKLVMINKLFNISSLVEETRFLTDTTIPSPSNILRTFSSEPPRNPRPCKNIFLSVQSLKIRIFVENLSTLGNK